MSSLDELDFVFSSECASMPVESYGFLAWVRYAKQEQAKLHDLQEEAKKREEQIISDLEAGTLAEMHWNLAL